MGRGGGCGASKGSDVNLLPANPTATQRAAEEDYAAAIVQGQFEAPQTQGPEPKQGAEPKLEPEPEPEPGPEVEEKAAAEPGEAEAKQAKETTAAAKRVKRPMKLKRFLLRYYPPGIILEYGSGGEDFTKPIDLLDLTPDTDVDVLLNQIIRQESLLSEKRKPQLSRLVNKLIDKLEENTEALRLAAQQGREELVGALAEGGADLDKADKKGVTSLMVAVRGGHSGVVRRLLELGADHTRTTWWGQTALELAVDDEKSKNKYDEETQQGKEEAAIILREWAASHPNEAYDAHIAAKAEEKERKAKQKERKTKQQVTRAAGPKAAAMYEALSEEDKPKADVLKGTPAEENEEALRYAAAYGDTAEMRVLLAAGTDPSAANEEGELALHRADTEVVRVLLAAGGDPDAGDEDGDTALHLAVLEDDENAVGALLEGGADLDKSNGDGETPLMQAAYMGHSGVVRHLLELGADHTAVGTGGEFEGLTALEIAEAEDEDEIAAVLRVCPSRQRLAFTSGSHARLGDGSPLSALPLDVLRRVAEAYLDMPRASEQPGLAFEPNKAYFFDFKKERWKYIGCAMTDDVRIGRDRCTSSEAQQLKQKSSIIISCGEAADDGKFGVRGRGGIHGKMGHSVRTGDAMSTKMMLKQLKKQFPYYPMEEE
jgi:ankyrin repeat protein